MPGTDFTWTVVYNHFPRLLNQMDVKVDAIVAKAALDIQANAQVRVPVRTGVLKNSIQATRVGKHHWRVVVGADYGIYVEHGTRFMGAQPYWHPAIAKVRPQFRAALRSVIA
jgi:HK97 gp10 family phage protein